MQVSSCDIPHSQWQAFPISTLCSENGTCNGKYALNDFAALAQHAEYKHEDPLVLYIHGFHEDPTKDTVEMVIKSYMTRGECNLVLIDWSHTAADLYPVVVPNVKPVSLNEFQAKVLWLKPL